MDFEKTLIDLNEPSWTCMDQNASTAAVELVFLSSSLGCFRRASVTRGIFDVLHWPFFEPYRNAGKLSLKISYGTRFWLFYFYKMIVRKFWKLRQFSQSTCDFYTTPKLELNTLCSLDNVYVQYGSVFNVHSLKCGLFVCKYLSYFESLMDVQLLWQVDVYQ